MKKRGGESEVLKLIDSVQRRLDAILELGNSATWVEVLGARL